MDVKIVDGIGRETRATVVDDSNAALLDLVRGYYDYTNSPDFRVFIAENELLMRVRIEFE